MNNYNGKAPLTVTALQGIKDRAGARTRCVMSPAVSWGWTRGAGKLNRQCRGDPAAEFAKPCELARQADVAIVFVGTNGGG